MSLLKRLEQLSTIPGVSGWEDNVRTAILTEIEGKCEYKIDALGNIIAFKKGRARAKNTVLFSAHMDEVGFIITTIDDSGLLRFATVGGIDSRCVVGKAVEIGENNLHGVIGTKPIHLQKASEQDKAPEIQELYIDIGAKSKDDAAKHIKLGDRAVFKAEFTKFGEDMLLGRAFDDRAGCALLLEMIDTELAYDCVFSFTVQEETGCTGAITAAWHAEPDISVAIETTTASDIAGTPKDKTVCKLGEGPVISFMDRGTVYDHKLYSFAMELAERHSIAHQTKHGVFGGNEARSLQAAKAGSRTLAISLPCRYLHTASNMLAEKDLQSTFELLKIFAEEAANL